MSDRVIVFDTTLRDGEQSPGCSMNTAEKLEVAAALVDLGVDVIEAGFPIASPGDFEAVQAVARQFGSKGPTICGLARCRDEDIDRAGAALQPAANRRIHVFLATSAIHREFKLKMGKEEILKRTVAGVKRARQYVDDVEFSPEDAARTELEFLAQVVEQAIAAGATTVNIPDTVGYATPAQYHTCIAYLKKHVPNIDRAVISTHCHNDLGLAVANSLAAVLAGARQVECTINGLGERAGNASLEEIVMAVRTRADVFPVETRIDTTQIVPASKLVSQITGYPVQPNKAVVGANAFAHESGIHQDGVLKHRETYEIMRAQDVGWSQNKLVLGKHSGRNAFKTRLQELGIELDSDEALNAAFARFKELADRKHEIFDEDLHALVSDEVVTPEQEHYKLLYSHVCSETGEMPHAKVILNVGGVEQKGEAGGGGPVDATFKAIESIAASGAELQLYSVNAITTGTDAQGEVTTRLSRGGRIVNGNGADTDIVIASARSYLNALNKLHVASDKVRAQGDV